MWDDLTIGYLAALIDGEGHIGVTHRDTRVVVVSTDLDILERAHSMSGIGKIRGPIESKWRPRWEWRISTRKDVARILCAIAPIMSQRKRITQIFPSAEFLHSKVSPKFCDECQKSFFRSFSGDIRIYCSNECKRLGKNRKQRSYYHRTKDSQCLVRG